MKKISIKPARPIYPSPAALITCVDTQGRSNIITLGEVVAVHVDEDKLDADGNVLPDRLDPLAYVAGEYWTFGQRLASHGFSRDDRTKE